MSKIKFSLIDSRCTNRNYSLVFAIHDQDMSHRPNSVFQASNGFIIDTKAYCYINKRSLGNRAYLRSVKFTKDPKSESGNSSCQFDSYSEMIEFKELFLDAIKEWCNG